MRKVRVAAAQLGPHEFQGDILERIYELLKEAHGSGVELVVLPELALTPYFARWKPTDDWMSRVTEPVPWEEISGLCKEFSIDLILPTARVDKITNSILNSAAIINSQGDLLGFYDKLHLPHTTKDSDFTIYEREWFAPGATLPIFQLQTGLTGSQICYDRHFPEGFAALSEGGAQVITLSSNSPLYGAQATWRKQAWLNLCRVRAAENKCVIVASCKAGREYGWDYIGHSCVVDQEGSVIAMAETEGDELIVATVTINNLDSTIQSPGSCVFTDQ